MFELLYYICNLLFQEGAHRKESGKRGRKPGRKSADKVDMKAKLGKKYTKLWNCLFSAYKYLTSF